MRRFIFFILAFSLYLNHAAGAEDLDALLQNGEEYIYKWQIRKASDIADKAFELAENPGDKGRVYYLKSQVEFYKGNYRKAVDYAKEAHAIFPEGKEISGFLNYASQIAKTGDKFKEAKTERFLIRYSHPKDAALIGYTENTLERAYFEIGQDLGIYPGDPVVVEIYPDPESFALASTLSEKDIETTGVVGICKFNRIMIISPRLLPKGYTWLDTLAHEYAHYLLFVKNENTVPVWLHEGIAKFEEKRWRDKSRDVIGPFYETLLAKALKDNSLVPMEEMHPSFGKLGSAYRAQLAFAQVGTIVDFLVKVWGDDGLLRLLRNIKENDDYEAAIKQATEMDFSDFYDSWKRDLNARNLTEKIPGVRVKELEFQNEEESSPGKENAELNDLDNSKAREYARLGDMLKVRGRPKAAVYEYEKALNFDPVSPVILNRLAEVQTSLGEYEKAQEKLSRSTEFHPEYVNTYINLGRIYLGKKSYKEAEESYKTAISINPFDPEPHVALVSIYEKLGMPGPAEAERRVLDILIGKK